jgi:hypothetical protein
MDRTDADWREAIKRRALPEPPSEPILVLRWVAGTGNWYLKTTKSWYWLDGRGGRAWKPSVYGPHGEY